MFRSSLDHLAYFFLYFSLELGMVCTPLCYWCLSTPGVVNSRLVNHPRLLNFICRVSPMLARGMRGSTTHCFLFFLNFILIYYNFGEDWILSLNYFSYLHLHAKGFGKSTFLVYITFRKIMECYTLVVHPVLCGGKNVVITL